LVAELAELAESILELSDDDTLNEASETGVVNAQKEADRTRAVLRNTLQKSYAENVGYTVHKREASGT
jgi:hypothetical protein